MDKWLRNLTVVRIVALALGILLWAVVHLEETAAPGKTESTVQKLVEINGVSITIVGLDETQHHIQSMEPSEVTVKIKGKEAALAKVNTKSMKIQLDLSNRTAGEHIMPLEGKGFPAGVQVEIVPSYVTVRIEDQQMKEMQVTIDVTGTPEQGYKAGVPIVKPSRVHITLPTSRLDEIAYIRAEVNIDGVQSDVTKEVKLLAYDHAGKEVQVAINPSVVDVEIPITSPFKEMPLQIRIIGEPPPGYSIVFYNQSATQVTVYGPQSILDSIEFYDGLQIDLSSFTHDQLITLELPLKDQVEQVEPKVVEVEIHIVPSEMRVFEQVSIAIIGQDDGYEAQVNAPEEGKITFTLEAAPEIWKAIKAEDIQVSVDVSNLPPGEHELPLVFDLPAYVKKETKEMMVIVEIKDKSTEVLLPDPEEEPAEPIDTADEEPSEEPLPAEE